MTQLQVWILTGLVSVLAGVCGYCLNKAVSLVLARLDKIVVELQTLQLTRATHTQEITHLQEKVDDHEDRIRKVEFKQITEKL